MHISSRGAMLSLVLKRRIMADDITEIKQKTDKIKAELEDTEKELEQAEAKQKDEEQGNESKGIPGLTI